MPGFRETVQISWRLQAIIIHKEKMIIWFFINIKTKNKLIINEELNLDDSTNEFLRNAKQINDMCYSYYSDIESKTNNLVLLCDCYSPNVKMK